VTDKLSAALDSYDPNVMQFLSNALVLGLHDNRKAIRSALESYLKSTLPLIIAKIKNRCFKNKGTPDANDEFDTIVSNVMKNEPFALAFAIASGAQDTITHTFIDTSDDADKNAIKNIALLMDQLMNVINTIVEIPVKYRLDSKCALLSLTIVNHIFKSLHEYLTHNVVEVDVVLKKVEQLREQKKQAMMSAYLVDDQERQLQIQLRNIGLETWSTVFDRLKNVDINTLANQKEENENYNMADYRGENDDGDNDEDNDFARGE
jgi:hypothetical protein